jgi:hypothetical protein
MVALARCGLMMLLLGSWAACVGIKPEPSADGGAPGPDASSAEDTRTTTPDASAAPRSCRDIRVCVFACGADQGCAARCESSAPAVARLLHEQSQMCSLRVCPEQDIECRCDQECHGGGACTDLVDECDEAISDPFCDGPCH